MNFDPAFFKMITDYGLAIVALFFVTKFLMWLIKFILERNKIREDMYMSLMSTDIKRLCETMLTLTNTVANFTIQVSEAHRYQKEEHLKLAENQTKTHECLTSLNLCLKQVEESLGRINGYQH